MNYKNRITGQQVTAIQWNDDADNKDIEVFCGYWASIREEKFGGIWVTTQVGNTIQRNLKSGRWVVKHSEGMFEVLENEEFVKTFVKGAKHMSESTEAICEIAQILFAPMRSGLNGMEVMKAVGFAAKLSSDDFREPFTIMTKKPLEIGKKYKISIEAVE